MRRGSNTRFRDVPWRRSGIVVATRLFLAVDVRDAHEGSHPATGRGSADELRSSPVSTDECGQGWPIVHIERMSDSVRGACWRGHHMCCIAHMRGSSPGRAYQGSERVAPGGRDVSHPGRCKAPSRAEARSFARRRSGPPCRSRRRRARARRILTGGAHPLRLSTPRCDTCSRGGAIRTRRPAAGGGTECVEEPARRQGATRPTPSALGAGLRPRGNACDRAVLRTDPSGRSVGSFGAP